MEIPPVFASLVAGWESLSRWERAELGRALRRLGWSYGEIMAVLPVAKGTLAGWCREIRLTSEQALAIRRRTGSRKGVPRDTQRKRRAEVERIRANARQCAPTLAADPLWTAGVALYWAEGSKTERRLELANADARVLRVFIRWTRSYHQPDARFALKLHLHEGNDDELSRAHWRAELELERADFHKTFIKPAGTGHRKNTLPHGVCRVLVRRSSDGWYRTMEWIDWLGLLAHAPDC